MFKKEPSNQTMRERYQTDECLICFKNKYEELNFSSFFKEEDLLCQNCRQRLKVVNQVINLSGYECLALYEYNKFFKQHLLQYKELFDEALYPIFLYPFKERIEKEYRKYTLIFVPSTQVKKEKRGFDHLEKMFSLINLKKENIFENDSINSQKNSSYQERQEVKEHLKLIKNLDDLKTPLLLVDDVITTGASLRACLELLKDYKYPIKVLVVSCNHSYLKE